MKNVKQCGSSKTKKTPSKMAYYYSQHHSLTLIRHYIQNHPTNIYGAHTIYNPVPGAEAPTKSKSDKFHTLRELMYSGGGGGGVGL